MTLHQMYASSMEVAVTELRSRLSEWIGRARQGEEIIVTDRGLPVARLTSVDSTSLVERLVREGVLAPPEQPRRPRARGAARVMATGSVSDLVGEQRR